MLLTRTEKTEKKTEKDGKEEAAHI